MSVIDGMPRHNLMRGRKVGSKNAFTREIKSALAQGGKIAGDRMAATTKVKSQGIATYFGWLAVRHPAIYCELLKGALPREMTGSGEDGEIEVVYRNIVEVKRELDALGLPVPDAFKLPYVEGAIIEEVAVEEAEIVADADKEESVLKG